MSLMEDVSDRGLGWPLGLGLVVAAVSMGPQLVKSGRPVMKKAIKAYLALEDKAKEMMAETSERMQDLYAEAKHEYEQGETVMEVQAHHEPEHKTEPAEGSKPTRSRKSKHQESEEG